MSTAPPAPKRRGARARRRGARDHPWYSTTGNEFRIDRAFATAALVPRFGAVRYGHEMRVDGASDHASLVVDVTSLGSAI